MLKKGEEKIMKTFKFFMEGIKKWADVKDRKVKGQASQLLKSLDVGEVLGWSAEHEEFSVFKNEKEFKDSMKGSKGKAMKWIQVEHWIREAMLDEAYKPTFNFKAAVKIGMLDKSDEKPILSMKKMGWEIKEFILTSKGFELTIINKKKQELEYTDRRPDYVLQKAEKALTTKRGRF
tara:strand:- start:50 stop:580 length:531 start_codon:yes stop_codon:yes gene_type:complete